LTIEQKELKGMRMMQTWNRVGMGEKWDDEGIIELLQRILPQGITFCVLHLVSRVTSSNV